MFMRFFTELREAKVPVTLKEYLMLMEALDKAVIGRNVEEFYYLARSALVKDEKNLDRFDQVFGHVFKGLEKLEGPEGVRIGQDKGRHGRAVKVWDKREYKNLDDSVELGTRNIKVALRRLRKWTRDGAAEELDMDGTIRGTAEKGYLDIKLRPERRNKISVLIFFDVGGSMDSHIRVCEELFSAARTEFKNMEFYYFHNCLYESVWKDNRRRHAEKIPTWDVLHKFSRDYKVIFVGDATMSPYEITYPGGSVEHWNEEPGAIWVDRVAQTFEDMVWLNPTAERHWDYTPSVEVMRQLVGDRMFPLTLEGLEKAMKELAR